MGVSCISELSEPALGNKFAELLFGVGAPDQHQPESPLHHEGIQNADLQPANVIVQRLFIHILAEVDHQSPAARL